MFVSFMRLSIKAAASIAIKIMAETVMILRIFSFSTLSVLRIEIALVFQRAVIIEYLAA